MTTRTPTLEAIEVYDSLTDVFQAQGCAPEGTSNHWSTDHSGAGCPPIPIDACLMATVFRAHSFDRRTIAAKLQLLSCNRRGADDPVCSRSTLRILEGREEVVGPPSRGLHAGRYTPVGNLYSAQHQLLDPLVKKILA